MYIILIELLAADLCNQMSTDVRAKSYYLRRINVEFANLIAKRDILATCMKLQSISFSFFLMATPYKKINYNTKCLQI